MMTPFSENALKITKDDFEILKLNFEIFFYLITYWKKLINNFLSRKYKEKKIKMKKSRFLSNF